MMKSWQRARFAAATTSSCVALGLPNRMLFSTVSLNRYTFWNTIEMFSSRLSAVPDRTSAPPMVTRPSSTSQKRASRFTNVVLPEPLGPMSAHVEPSGMRRLTPSMTRRPSP